MLPVNQKYLEKGQNWPLDSKRGLIEKSPFIKLPIINNWFKLRG